MKCGPWFAGPCRHWQPCICPALHAELLQVCSGTGSTAGTAALQMQCKPVHVIQHGRCVRSACMMELKHPAERAAASRGASCCR